MTYKVYLSNRRANCCYRAFGRTKRKAFDNALHKAGPAFMAGWHTLADDLFTEAAKKMTGKGSLRMTYASDTRRTYDVEIHRIGAH